MAQWAVQPNSSNVCFPLASVLNNGHAILFRLLLCSTRLHGNHVSTSLNRYEFEMPTELASEDPEQDSDRVEQQQEEPPQIINGTRLPASSLVLLSYEHELETERNYESVIDTFASARARRVNIIRSS